jgi:hypothetical protein
MFFSLGSQISAPVENIVFGALVYERQTRKGYAKAVNDYRKAIRGELPHSPKGLPP